jgi:hypothetical protein
VIESNIQSRLSILFLLDNSVDLVRETIAYDAQTFLLLRWCTLEASITPNDSVTFKLPKGGSLKNSGTPKTPTKKDDQTKVDSLCFRIIYTKEGVQECILYNR